VGESGKEEWNNAADDGDDWLGTAEADLADEELY